ncbi:MAG: SGNH/GDSL hydrolase family protein [Bacteriovoracaceae bacterium]|nr:SGNH/GDSL hydrolase family protein [Bacteriovoracaceae bacterium]
MWPLMKLIVFFFFMVYFLAMENNSYAVIKIMPLGDSLTEGGYNSKGNDGEWKWYLGPGYREELYHQLTSHGFNVEFVGSVTDRPSYFLQTQHEGHSGYTVSQLNENIDRWLRISSPDIILLMIGTNNVVKNVDLEKMSSLYHDLLTKILNKNHKTRIFLASPLPTGDQTKDPKRETVWNSEIKKISKILESLALARTKQGYLVHYVDMFGSNVIIPEKDLPDGVHPTKNGYQKLGRKWFSVIKSFLKP